MRARFSDRSKGLDNNQVCSTCSTNKTVAELGYAAFKGKRVSNLDYSYASRIYKCWRACVHFVEFSDDMSVNLPLCAMRSAANKGRIRSLGTRKPCKMQHCQTNLC